MFNWIINLFKKKVFVYYNTKGVIITDNTNLKDNHSFVRRRDFYTAEIKLRKYNSNLKVYVYKNFYAKNNIIEDAITYTEDGATIKFKVTKDINKIIIATETIDKSPKINLSLTPINYTFPCEGGVVTFLAKAEEYNSLDNPEMFKFAAEGPAMKHQWYMKDSTLTAIMAPHKEYVDCELTAKIYVFYKGYSTYSTVTQDYRND